MNTADLLAISPILCLSGFILVVMLCIGFARNLVLTTLISSFGLLLTFCNIVWVAATLQPRMVTPLLKVDDYALTFSALFVTAALMICLLAYDYFRDKGEHQEEFMLLLLLATLGAVTLAHCVHFGSFILGLELIGVSLYAMISYPDKGFFTLEAALKYLILSGVSSAFILFGVALMFAVTGKLGFSQMDVTGDQLVEARFFLLIGLTLILCGMAFKLSLVPFHMWTPDVYEGAPVPATALLATVSKGAIFSVLLRFFIGADGYTHDAIMSGLYWVALLSIIAGNLLAVMQTSIKRILAYSSIAHLGYLMVAMIAAHDIGGRALAVEACIFFLIAYFATSIGAFGVVSVMSNGRMVHDLDHLPAYAGLFWRRPLLAVFFSAMLLSLAGIPLTAGFIGKFYIVATGVDAGLWDLLAAVVVGSGIGLFYYLRVIYTMSTKSADEAEIQTPVVGGWVLGVITGVLLLLGVYPGPLIEWVAQVALTIY